jgi:paraquat-inducible protein A
MAAHLIACQECDLLQRPAPLRARSHARCRRCYAVLYRSQSEELDRPLAFTLGATVLFVLANAFPIVGLELQGQSTTATLFGMVQSLYEEHMQMLALLVFFTTMLVPAVELAAMCYLLVPLWRGHVPARLPLALRLLQAVRPWGMVEVFMLGVLVALVKLGHVANVVPGLALWSFGGLMMMIAAAAATFDPRAIWARQELAT